MKGIKARLSPKNDQNLGFSPLRTVFLKVNPHHGETIYLAVIARSAGSFVRFPQSFAGGLLWPLVPASST